LQNICWESSVEGIRCFSPAQGQPFSGPEYRVYLLGNPVIWWSSLATMVVFICVAVCLSCRNRRRAAREIDSGGWLVQVFAVLVCSLIANLCTIVYKVPL